MISFLAVIPWQENEMRYVSVLIGISIAALAVSAVKLESVKRHLEFQ
jgi:hypothetical protein